MLGAGTSPLTDGGVRPELGRSSRGPGRGAPEQNFASKTIFILAKWFFATKNAYSEDVKHLTLRETGGAEPHPSGGVRAARP